MMKNTTLRADNIMLYAIALSVFCLMVLFVRIIYVQQKEYLFLAFNLALAVIPYMIALSIRATNRNTPLYQKMFLFIAWLLFFPNAPYIFTDIYHLDEYYTMPQWFDLLMLLSYSWCGLIWGFLSLQIVQKRYFSMRPKIYQILFIIGIFFLTGIGIYLGRYERWNSWDFMFRLPDMYERTIEILISPDDLFYMLAMGTLYCAVLSMFYWQFILKTNSKNN